MEEARVEIRNHPPRGHRPAQEGGAGRRRREDEARRQLDQLQKITDRVIADVDRLGEIKEQEVMEV